jgi:hypothetical protein
MPAQGMGDEGRPNCYVGLGEERRRDSRIIQESIDSLLLQDGGPGWLPRLRVVSSQDVDQHHGVCSIEWSPNPGENHEPFLLLSLPPLKTRIWIL